MNLRPLLSFFGVVTIALVACAKREPPAPAAERPAPSASAGAKAPSFQKDVLPVLTSHCATAPGCHGDDPTDSVHFDASATSGP